MAITLTTAPATVQLSKNPVFVKFLSTSHTSLDNYRVMLRVLFEDDYESGTYAEVIEVEAIPDSSGETVFDISAVLNSELERTIPQRVPDFANQIPYLADTLRRFKIQYLERYGTPPAEQSATTSSAYKVLYGGVDTHYFGLYDFFDNLATDNSLLTYYPSGKTISSDQPEYLSHICHQATSGYYAFLRVNQYDSSGAQISQFDKFRLSMAYTDLLFLDVYQVGVFPTGPEALGLNVDAVKYTVQVFAAGTQTGLGGLQESATPAAASQAFTYYIDHSARPAPQTLIWFNGFSAPHILRCQGRKVTRLEVQRLISEQVVGFNYDPTALATVQHSRTWNHAFSYRSGAISPEEKDALQELLIENRLLEYAADGNYYRLLVTGNSFQVYEQDTSPNYLEITAVRALAPRNFMRLRTITAGVVLENGWLVSDNGFWELGAAGGYWQL